MTRERQEYQRNLGPVRGLTEGQYTIETATGRPALCCKRCGTIAELPTTHTPMKGGRVDLIWTCPAVSCPETSFITLCDIDEEVAR